MWRRRFVEKQWNQKCLNRWCERNGNSISLTSERSEWENRGEVSYKKKVAADSSTIGHVLWQRTDITWPWIPRRQKKHNLQIEVDNPSMNWGIYNFVIPTRSEAAFPSAVVGKSIVRTLWETGAATCMMVALVTLVPSRSTQLRNNCKQTGYF